MKSHVDLNQKVGEAKAFTCPICRDGAELVYVADKWRSLAAENELLKAVVFAAEDAQDFWPGDELVGAQRKLREAIVAWRASQVKP